MANNGAMHLLELKESTGQSFLDLAKASGVLRSNLCDIAHGWKWVGQDTAPRLLKLGVDLNDQAKFYASRAEERAIRAARLAAEKAGEKADAA